MVLVLLVTRKPAAWWGVFGNLTITALFAVGLILPC